MQILSLILFVFFAVLGAAKSIILPNSIKEVFSDFSRVSYLGSFIVSFDNMITGVVFFYNDRQIAIWTAYGLFWVAMALTVIVGCAALLVSCCYQSPHDVSEVTGM